MMVVKTFVCNMLDENCYVVSDDSRECIIIDCGAFTDEEKRAIVDYITSENLKPVHLIATHGHLDHNFGNKMVYDTYSLGVEVGSADVAMIGNARKHAKSFYHYDLGYDLPPVGNTIADGDIITFGNHSLEVISTPGHSAGSACLYCKEENMLFSGDTLFRTSIGRTDLGGGSMMQIIQSLRRIAQLPDNTTVYPGHGIKTTIGYELNFNPFMDR